jgi:hypothetical protein
MPVDCCASAAALQASDNDTINDTDFTIISSGCQGLVVRKRALAPYFDNTSEVRRSIRLAVEIP